jgi:hypothetical protein
MVGHKQRSVMARGEERSVRRRRGERRGGVGHTGWGRVTVG